MGITEEWAEPVFTLLAVMLTLLNGDSPNADNLRLGLVFLGSKQAVMPIGLK
jgi:hypothetical protein